MRGAFLAPLAALALAASGAAQDRGSCLYFDETGFIRQAPRLQEVPSQHRAKAKCSSGEPGQIPEPRSVDLDGPVRSTSFLTDLGRMQVRWQRKVEECFGKSPSKAVHEAARASNRAIKNARFAPEARQEKRDWQLVFVDKATALAEFPAFIALGSHPGFMVPPSQIYIVTDFIPGSCAGSQVADAVLTQVLLHEMGHVVEHMLLGDASFSQDRPRSEGFASWFEQYSADYAGDIPRGEVVRYYDGLAREGLGTESVAAFDGSPQAYAVSALRFRAIVDRKGISGLMRVYGAMRGTGIPFSQAVHQELGWSDGALHREMARLLKQGH